MTEVAFHFNAPDKLAYVCRFARKALRQDARVVITGSGPDLQRLDRMLWAMRPVDFVAHCADGADAQLRELSPVLLTTDPASTSLCDVLVNVGDAVPAGFERFARVIEVVSQADEGDRAQARARWRHYAEQGYAIIRHDLVLKEG